MSIANRPDVLVIDDEPDAQRIVFGSASDHGASFEVFHPEEVTADQLNDADLVLVDYIIKTWKARDEQEQIALRPDNGLALAAVLREQANLVDRPTGFALHTGRPEELWLTPAEPRRHLIARAYNLEWVFLKTEPTEVVRQAAILAAAIQSLPASWPGDDHAKAEEIVQELLGLRTAGDAQIPPGWFATALADVESCGPPITELSERNHGLVFLRWLLQRILPYPCFLLDSHRLAARLRISHHSLQQGLTQGLREFLEPCRYRGALAGFSGDRWWRAGVESLLWDLTEGASAPADALRGALSKAANTALSPSASDPIVCIDENYSQLPEALPADTVVRVQPDDWPLYASQAWTPVELARQHPRLRALVVAEDRDKLQPQGEGRPG